jgi:hypothetical protein
VAPTISREGGQHPAFARASQNMAIAVALLDMLPPPSTDEVEWLYHELGEILIIVAASQVECARYRRARDPTSSLVSSRAVEPSVARVAPPPARFLSQGSPWKQGQRTEHLAHHQAYHGDAGVEPTPGQTQRPEGT